MHFFRTSILFLATTFISCLSPLNATVYEDAEDNKTSRWKVVFSPTLAEVKNYYDDKKVSRVINFKGEGTKTIFELSSKKNRKKSLKKEFWLSWEMKFNEDIVIIVSLETTRGEDYLIYTQGFHKSYKQLGLGENICDGKWHRIERNLEEDLNYFDNRSKILALKEFVIKGNGSIDNIKTRIKKITHKNIKTKIKKIINKNIKIKKIQTIERPVVKQNNNSLPIIKIEGSNPLYLKKGESYVELGVSAYDKEDGELSVTSTENINVDKDGSYMVMYMAQDSNGDIALDKRIVNVGSGEKVEKYKSKIEEPIEKDISIR